MLQALQHPEVQGTAWLTPFVTDFKARFMSLLGGAFKTLPPALALSILNPKLVFSEAESASGVQEGVIVTRGDGRQMTPYDLKRLQVGQAMSQGIRGICLLMFVALHGDGSQGTHTSRNSVLQACLCTLRLGLRSPMDAW